jgi:hypothetical protein
MRVILKSSQGPEWRIDTPDPHVVGDWLKSIFDSFDAPQAPYYMPVEFQLSVSA